MDWAAVQLRAEALSAAHTISSGHRLADILHVATALHLGVTEFLTFDSNQKKLALAEAFSLSVPLTSIFDFFEIGFDAGVSVDRICPQRHENGNCPRFT